MRKRLKTLFSVPTLALLIALLITVNLYSTESPPFVLDAGTAKEESQVAATPPAIPAGEVDASRTTLVVIFSGSDASLDYTHKQEIDNWDKTFKLVNPGPRGKTAYLFLQGIKICTKETAIDCALFLPKVTANGAVTEDGKVTVEGNNTLDVTLRFQKIATTDKKDVKLVIVGDNLKHEVPFSIQPKSRTVVDDVNDILKGLSAVGSLKQFASTALESIIDLLLTVVSSMVYFLRDLILDVWQNPFLVLIFVALLILLINVLRWKVLPYFLQEKDLPFRMETTEDEGTKKLWTTFSGRIREMQEQELDQKMVIPPQPKPGDINLPTNVGKEGVLIKTIIDLLSWIIPRRGYSLRLRLVDYPKLGKGLSMSLIRSENEEVVEERIFWARDYGLDPEKVDVERLLITPAILWLSFSSRKYLSKDTHSRSEDVEKDEWKSKSCGILASEVWTIDPAVSKKLYTDSLFYDAHNRAAQAGLGRIWYEEGQGDELTAAEQRDCLELAVGFLEKASGEDPDKANATWFSAKYNLAVVRLRLSDWAGAKADCKLLLKTIQNHLAKEGENSFTDKAWLKRLQSMALWVHRSVKLEETLPSTIQKLKENIDKTIRTLAPKGNSSENWLLTDLHYRSQYNAACYFSRCYRIAKKLKSDPTANKCADLALNYLRLALGPGGSLVKYAHKDRVLNWIKKDFEKEFNRIAPLEKEKKSEAKETIENVTHLVWEPSNPDYIERLPGITEEVIKTFHKLSIFTLSDFLLNGVDANSRRQLQQKTNVEQEQLTWWLNLCDLTRVQGLSLDSAVLLESKGNVSTIKQLRTRQPQALSDQLGNRFTVEQLTKWIVAANELIPSLEYS